MMIDIMIIEKGGEVVAVIAGGMVKMKVNMQTSEVEEMMIEIMTIEEATDIIIIMMEEVALVVVMIIIIM